jgi:hypothetical protein
MSFARVKYANRQKLNFARAEHEELLESVH